VGGTGLYFKSLTEGLVKLPHIPEKIRKKIRHLQKKIGQKNFYKKLIILDPLVKKQIDENDSQRSIRAYEIKHYSKISIVQWFQKTQILFDPECFIKIYIDYPRNNLIEKISKRTETMMRDGAINEVKRFKKLKIKKENSANKIIGIEEIKKYLNGEINLEETKERIYVKTRQYAKRQTTWARGQMQSWRKIHPKDLTYAIKNLNNDSLNLTN